MPRLQSSRNELKFVIDERVAAGIQQFLRGHLRPDRDKAYPVCSVYLDSANARLYEQTKQGQRNRFKLRVRIYDDVPGHPAFVEVKRRDGQIIKKRRAPVDRETAVALLSGMPASVASANGCDALWKGNDWLSLSEFCRLRDAINAVGTTYVSYRREAYVYSDHNDWRATFDRQLSAGRYVPGNTVTIPADLAPTSDYDTVVFELKFTNRFPRWMADLVNAFNLSSVSFPKYINCRDSLSSRGAPPSLQAASDDR